MPRPDHSLSRKQISRGALKVLYSLRRAGYESYLVGGAVRDLLCGLTPKDFDVVTDAHPHQIRRLFQQAYIIGRRFRLVHVRFSDETVEVSTFRREQSASGDGSIVPLARDNAFGTLEEDEQRRDFTINALYYNIADFSIRDAVGGVEDLAKRRIRLIGCPNRRYQEDPVRMLRAIRLALKLGFELAPETATPLQECAPLLRQIPNSRLLEEFSKLLLSPHALQALESLQGYGLLAYLLPEPSAWMPARGETLNTEDEWKLRHQQLVGWFCKQVAKRIQSDQTVSLPLLFAVLLWYPFQKRWAARQSGLKAPDTISGMDCPAFQDIAADVLSYQGRKGLQLTALVKHQVQQLWSLQFAIKHDETMQEWLNEPKSRPNGLRAALHLYSGRQALERPEKLSEVESWLEQTDAPAPPRRRGEGSGRPTAARAASRLRRRVRARTPSEDQAGTGFSRLGHEKAIAPSARVQG